MDAQLLKSVIFIISLIIVFYILRPKEIKTPKKLQKEQCPEVDLSQLSEEEKEKLWREAVENLAKNKINYTFPCIDKRQKPPV